MPNSFHNETESPRRASGSKSLCSAAFCLVCMLGASGCLFQHKAKPVAYTPPPPRPPAKPEPRPALPLPPELKENLAIIILPDSADVFPNLPAPPAPPPKAKALPPPVIGPKPPVNPAPDVPTPRLGQIFTAEEIRTYTNDLNASLVRVNENLGKLARRRLGKEEVLKMEQIKTFQKQAEQARQEDLVTAVYLARRADLLAQDLLDHLP